MPLGVVHPAAPHYHTLGAPGLGALDSHAQPQQAAAGTCSRLRPGAIPWRCSRQQQLQRQRQL
jgi:hypothetical protein